MQRSVFTTGIWIFKDISILPKWKVTTLSGFI